MHLSQVLFNAALGAAAAAAASVASVEEHGIATVNLGTEKPHSASGPGPVNMGGTVDRPHWAFPPPKPVADAAVTPAAERNVKRSLEEFSHRKDDDGIAPRGDFSESGPCRRDESGATPEPGAIAKRFRPDRPFWKLRPAPQDDDGKPPRGDSSGPGPKKPWPGPRRRDESPEPKPKDAKPEPKPKDAKPELKPKDAKPEPKPKAAKPQDIMRLSAKKAARVFDKQCDHLKLAKMTLSAQCVTTWGEWHRTKINLNRCIGVDDKGQLVYKAEGKIGYKCTSCRLRGFRNKRVLKCSCKDSSGKAQKTKLALIPKPNNPAAIQVRNGHFYCGPVMGKSIAIPKRRDPRSE